MKLLLQSRLLCNDQNDSCLSCSDDEQEEAAGGDEGNDAGTPADDKAAADEGDQEAEGEEAAAAGGSKLPVEVGREQLMLEIICEVGKEKRSLKPEA